VAGARLLDGRPEYAEDILLERSVARFVKQGAHFHTGSLFFYPNPVPGGFIPWFVFLLIAFVFGLKAPRKKEEIRLSHSLVCSGSCLLHPIQGQEGHLHPSLYPAAAMMVGWLWDAGLSLPEPEMDRDGLALSALVSLVILVAALSGLPQRVDPRAEPYVGSG